MQNILVSNKKLVISLILLLLLNFITIIVADIDPLFRFIISSFLIIIFPISVFMIVHTRELMSDTFEFEGFIKIDRKFKIIDCNEKVLTIFNYNREELLQSSILDLVHETYLTIFNDLILKKEVYAQEIVGLDRDENLLNLVISFEFDRDGSENIYFIEKEKADFILRRLTTSTSYYYAFLQVAGLGMVERDVSDLYIEFAKLNSEGILDLRNYFQEYPDTYEEMKNMTNITQISAETGYILQIDDEENLKDYLEGNFLLDRDDTIELLNKLFNDIKISDRKIDIITSRGTEKIVLLRNSIPSKHNPKLITILIDVTEESRFERIIHKVNKKYEELISRAPIGIFTVFTNVILLANDKMAEIFGYPSKDDLIGMRVEELQPTENQEEYELRVQGKKRKRIKEDSFKSFGKRKNGEIIDIEVSSTFIQLEDEKFELVFIRDISQEIAMAKEKDKILIEIMESKRMEAMALLAGGIVHDFNNLLIGIIGGIELISLSGGLSNEVKNTIDIIKRASTQASQLTRSLMAYTGKEQLYQENVNVSDIIDDMRGLIKLSISEKVTVNYNLAKLKETIYISKVQMQQVILNTIINASEAIEDKGVINITTNIYKANSTILERENLFQKKRMEVGKNYIYISIEDTGKGMYRKEIQKIFDPFYTTKIKGKGLGLSVVHGIVVNQANGSILVESEVNKGTKISYFLPISTTKPEKTNLVLEEQLNSFSGKVLIIDDEEIVQHILRRYLEKVGFVVDIATNGKEGVSKFETYKQYELCFIDLTLPDIDGYEVFNSITNKRSDIPIIFISGHAELDDRKLNKYPFYTFINKPFTLDMILKKINSVIKLVEKLI